MDLVRIGTNRSSCQPLDDGDGQHRFLLNDGKEIKLRIGSYGHHTTGHQPSEAFQPPSPVVHSYFNNYQSTPNISMPPKLKFKVSRATKVVEPEPTPPPMDDVIVIEDDDDDNYFANHKPKVTSGSSQPYNIGSTTWMGYSQPSQEQVQIGEGFRQLKLDDYSTVPTPEEKPNDFIPKIEIEELKTTVPTEVFYNKKVTARTTSEKVQCYDKPSQNVAQETGLNLRVDNLQLDSSLEEILNLFDTDITSEELDPFTKTKELDYQEGQVVYGEPVALLSLLENTVSLRTGEHGVMVNTLSPSSLKEYQCENEAIGKKGQYSVVKDLGTGSYGKVQLCVDRSSDIEFVKKTIFREFCKNEVTAILFLDHPNIVKLFGFIQNNGMAEMYMEYAGTSLLHFTVEPATSHRLDESTIWDFTKQGLSALEYLDNNGIIHYDLKPENLCVLDKGEKFPKLTLTDFGSAKARTEQPDFKGWTAEYMAPELGQAFVKSKMLFLPVSSRDEMPVTGKADVFALGLVTLFMYQRRHVLMHFFTNGKDSYKDIEHPERIRMNMILVSAKDPDIVHRLMISDKCSDNMKIVLQGMLTGSPRERLSAQEALRKMEELETRTIQQPSTPSSSLWATTYGENQALGFPCQVSEHRRKSTVCTSAALSFDSNVGSPVGYPHSPGAVKLRSTRKKQRRKATQPYDHINKEVDTNYKDLTPAENLDGNVPNFSLF